MRFADLGSMAVKYYFGRRNLRFIKTTDLKLLKEHNNLIRYLLFHADGKAKQHLNTFANLEAHSLYDINFEPPNI